MADDKNVEILIRAKNVTADAFAAVTKALETIDARQVSLTQHAQLVQQQFAKFSGDGLIQEAHALATAVQQVGGSSKLTEQELADVNKTVSAAIDKYKALGQTAPTAMLALADATKPLPEKVSLVSKTIGDLTDHVKATALGFISAQAIIGGVQSSFHALTAFVGSSIESYASAEAAAKKMTTALEAQGQATPDVIQHYNDLATQFQKTTVYSDDLINEMEALLTQIGDVAPSQMEKALDAATNLASGLGVDLETATTLVAKAFAGHTESLGKYGIVLDEAKVKSQGMSYVLDQIQARFGGQAQAEVETYAGKIKRLANEWDNLKETVGKKTAEDPVLQALIAGTTREVSAQAESLTGAASSWDKWTQRLSFVVDPSQAAVTVIEKLTGKVNEAGDAFTRASAMAVKLQLPQGAGLSLKSIDPLANKTIEDTIALWKKEDEAAKQHAETIQQLADRYSGTAIATKIRDLAEAMRHLPATSNWKLLAEDAGKLFQEGAKLTPEMMRLALSFGQLSPKIIEIDQLFKGFGGQIVDETVPAMQKIWEQIDKLDPSKAAVGISNLREEFAALVVESPETMLKGVLIKTHDVGKALGELSQAFAQMSQIAGGSLGGLIQRLGTMVAALETAKKGADSFQEGQKAWKSGNTMSGIVGMTAGIMGIASAALSAGKAIKDLFFGTAGRDAVKEFAATFQVFNLDTMHFNAGGGFEELHQKLLQLSDPTYGEKLWRALTQGVGRNNPEQAKAVIDLITKALGEQKTAIDGTATAAAAAGDAQSEATTKALEAIKGMDDQIKSLSASIAGEAPEEFMGIVESNTRAQIKAIAAERDAAQKALDETTQAAGEAAGNAADGVGGVADRAKDALEEFRKWKDAINDAAAAAGGFVMPGYSDTPSASHADGAYIRRDHVANVHQGEIVGPTSFIAEAMRQAWPQLPVGGGGVGAVAQNITLMIDGQRLSDILVRLIPDSVQRFGVR